MGAASPRSQRCLGRPACAPRVRSLASRPGPTAGGVVRRDPQDGVQPWHAAAAVCPASVHLQVRLAVASSRQSVAPNSPCPVPPWPHPGRRAPNAATSCGAPPDAPERPSHCWLLLISPADQPLADLLPRRNTVLVTLTIFREGQIPCRLVATPRRAPTMQAVGLQCGGSAPASGTVIAWPSVQGDAVRGWVPAAPRPRRGR